MLNYREKMREYLKEPNEYSNQYGKWDNLNSEQRQLIKRLLDEMDRADAVIKKQYEEKQQIISFLKNNIKETDEKINVFYETHIDKNCPNLESKLETFKEVLNFVNKDE